MARRVASYVALGLLRPQPPAPAMRAGAVGVPGADPAGFAAVLVPPVDHGRWDERQHGWGTRQRWAGLADR